MNRPDTISTYDELDLKLGIKSSLPHVKSTIALAVLLWECAGCPAELAYAQQDGDRIILTNELSQQLTNVVSEICDGEEIDLESLIITVNDNQLFKSQMEALIVAFELVWKLAKVNFIDDDKAASAERTGGTRYPKKLTYTINADIIHSLIKSDRNAYMKILIAWAGVNIVTNSECENNLLHLLTALSEGAVFKLADGNREVIFNQNNLYKKILETQEAVDVNGDKEAKGSLRILKSFLSDAMNPYLNYDNGRVVAADSRMNDIEEYQKRVEMFLRLSATKVIGLDSSDAENEGLSTEPSAVQRLTTGCNVLLYGVPGSGKSFTIDNIVKDSDYERVVFHPDYTYSDFVGQIMPRLKMNEDGIEKLTYEFVPGPFTKALKTAENDKDHMHYLIIEEINRGNAPAIFGDIFQLLDRDENGQGKYCITNYDIAREVFGEGNETTAIRIPSNLSILATMNTSDQNVFTLDTAFQRRWNMRYIENNITGAAHANDKIEHSDITWGSFASVVNEEILEYNAGLASSEDKQLGAYFVGKDELSSDRFPEKALKYLWDDAFKLERDKIFNQEIKSIGDIISNYEKNIQQGNDPIKGVLKWEVYKKMMDMSADSIEEAIDESEVFETETIDGE